MIKFFTTSLNRFWSLRLLAKKEADLLLAVMPNFAFDHSFKQSRNMSLSESERYHALHVRRILEQRVGISNQVDTATRYLQG